LGARFLTNGKAQFPQGCDVALARAVFEKASQPRLRHFKPYGRSLLILLLQEMPIIKLLRRQQPFENLSRVHFSQHDIERFLP
jgi:hypothetical protein